MGYATLLGSALLAPHATKLRSLLTVLESPTTPTRG